MARGNPHVHRSTLLPCCWCYAMFHRQQPLLHYPIRQLTLGMALLCALVTLLSLDRDERRIPGEQCGFHLLGRDILTISTWLHPLPYHKSPPHIVCSRYDDRIRGHRQDVRLSHRGKGEFTWCSSATPDGKLVRRWIIAKIVETAESPPSFAHHRRLGTFEATATSKTTKGVIIRSRVSTWLTALIRGEMTTTTSSVMLLYAKECWKEGDIWVVVQQQGV